MYSFHIVAIVAGQFFVALLLTNSFTKRWIDAIPWWVWGIYAIAILSAAILTTRP